MKVYAKYFTDGEFNYRKNTILQFGNSWKLIGSIFLINPGSATPIENQNIDDDVLQKLIELSKESKDDWFEFSVDATMRWIANLFSNNYLQQGKPDDLDGVIQLFNLFNLRDQNLGKAIDSLNDNHSTHLFSTDSDIEQCSDKPVYMGWGATGKYDGPNNFGLRNKAEYIFTKLLPNAEYLDTIFENNSFYHPRYIQMSYKKPHVQALLNNFKENKNIHTPQEYGQFIENISNKDLADAVKSLIFDLRNLNNKFIEENKLKIQEVTDKLIRLSFITSIKDELVITITHQNDNRSGQKGGYIGLRPSNHINKLPNSSYSQMLNELSFEETNTDTWLGRSWIKNIVSCFDKSSIIPTEEKQQIIKESILETIKNLLNGIRQD